MSRLLLTIALSALISAGLAGCAHRYEVHCDLINGTWQCDGAAEGSLPAE